MLISWRNWERAELLRGLGSHGEVDRDLLQQALTYPLGVAQKCGNLRRPLTKIPRMGIALRRHIQVLPLVMVQVMALLNLGILRAHILRAMVAKITLQRMLSIISSSTTNPRLQFRSSE